MLGRNVQPSFHCVLGLRQPCAYQANDGIHGAIKEAYLNHEVHKDPLQGIGGPMTRSRAKRMKHALHGILVQLQEDDATWIRASMEAKSPNYITYIRAEFEPQGNDHEVRPSHEAQSGHNALIEAFDG